MPSRTTHSDRAAQPYEDIRVTCRCPYHGEGPYRPTALEPHVFETLICEQCNEEAIAHLERQPMPDGSTPPNRKAYPIPFSYEVYLQEAY